MRSANDSIVTPIAIPLMRRVRRIHFIGIGGAGMCGIAEVLLNLGYEISGSDLVATDVTQRLQSLGVNVSIGHHAANVHDVDVVVVSSAVADDNTEIAEARALHVPVVSRAEMLGELMRHRYGIAIAGTHGKTTVTSLISSIFQEAGKDPTFVIGGLLNSEGRNARLGASQYLIAEADESDASFLLLNPILAVITNIDRDHLGTYGHDFAKLQDAFAEFVHRLPFYGLVILCIDDPVLRSIMPRVARPIVTYGLSDDADYQARYVHYVNDVYRFSTSRPRDLSPINVDLALPGEQNVRNALAAIAVASEEGIDDADVVNGLQQFQGIGRRFEMTEITALGSAFTLIDDYGHHPSEVQHVIDTTRTICASRRIVMVYQPHRYTRTRDLFDAFVSVLIQVDVLILLDTYPASESQIDGADAVDLAHAINESNRVFLYFACTVSQAIGHVTRVLKTSDVLVVQGAGNVDQVSIYVKAVAS